MQPMGTSKIEEKYKFNILMGALIRVVLKMFFPS